MEKSHGPRQPYEPPRIRKITIAPEELAVAACKHTMVMPYLCQIGSRLVVRTQGS
jgi:hypothetical protein